MLFGTIHQLLQPILRWAGVINFSNSRNQDRFTVIIHNPVFISEYLNSPLFQRIGNLLLARPVVVVSNHRKRPVG